MLTWLHSTMTSVDKPRIFSSSMFLAARYSQIARFSWLLSLWSYCVYFLFIGAFFVLMQAYSYSIHSSNRTKLHKLQAATS